MEPFWSLKLNGVEDQLLLLLKRYLENQKQRVILNSQISEGTKTMSAVPQESALGPLSFSIYINDFPDEINSLCKIFEDDASIFSKVDDIHKSTSKLNNNLEKISYWAYQWLCSLIQVLPDTLKKLFSLQKQVQITYNIHLSNLTIMKLLHFHIKSTLELL